MSIDPSLNAEQYAAQYAKTDFNFVYDCMIDPKTQRLVDLGKQLLAKGVKMSDIIDSAHLDVDSAFPFQPAWVKLLVVEYIRKRLTE